MMVLGLDKKLAFFEEDLSLLNGFKGLIGLDLELDKALLYALDMLMFLLSSYFFEVRVFFCLVKELFLWFL